MKKVLLFLATVLLATQSWAAPVITAITVSATTPTTATITWTTGAGATSQVLYGLNGLTNLSTDLDGTLVTSHSVTVASLAAGPIYTFSVKSQDSTGSTTSSTNTFSLCAGRLNTSATGTINVAYEYGNYTITLVNDSGSVASPTVCGTAVTSPISGNLDLHGNLTVSLPDNNLIVPGPSRWQVSVTSFTGTGGAIGAFNFTTKITGNSQDLTSLLQVGASGQLQHVIYDPATTSFNPPISGSGTVTSVNATTNAPWLTIGGVPITGGGTITINAATGLTANQFVATPNGSTGPAGLRGIVGADLPAINLAASGAGGITGNLPITNLDSGTGAGTLNAVWCGTGHWCVPPGTGTATSVGLSLPASLFSVSGSPVTTSGTLTGSFASIGAHLYLGNNTSGSATAALVQPVVADIVGAAPAASPTFTGTVTMTGKADGCAQFGTSGVLTSTGVACGSGGGGASITVNGGSALTSPVNFQNGSAVTGITINISNPSGSNVQAAISGTLTNAGLANSAITINGTSVSLGGTRTLTLASADFVNQGTTTTVLHGNAAGNPAFGAVVLTTDVSGILPGANGGSANGFFAVSGPATSLKTFTFPNASSTVLTSNAAVTVAQGGTGVGTLTAHGVLFGEGTSNITASTAGSLDTVLVGQGASADPIFQSVNDCTGAGKALTRDNTAHTFGCNTISGSGTVNSATINQIGVYSATGTAISGDTLFTDDGNVLTYAGAGGMALTSSAAGVVSLGQGTAQGLGTNAVGLTVPSGVTSWNLLFAGAAGSGYMKGSNSSNIVTQSFEANIDLAADVGATILPTANGGTGIASPVVHKLLVSNGTSPMTQLAVASTGTILTGVSTSDPAFSATPTLGGTSAALTGTLGFCGATSGCVTIQSQTAAGTWNFNLPTTAGTAGQVLTSQGGVGTAMTWTTVSGTGTVTNVATTSPITGGPITSTGTIACATCVTSAASLASTSVVLGSGSQGTQTVAGFTTDGTSVLTLGVAGTSVGGVDLKNATSGTLSLRPPTGALGTVTVTVPAATDTLVNLAGTQTLTNKTLTSPTLTTPALGTPASGTLTNVTGLPVSGLVSATGAIPTLANGDNPLVVNCATTTSGQICHTIGETTASTSAGTPYEVRVTTLVGSTASPLKVDNSLNGSQTLCTVCILPTWNTTGVVDAALLINPTNTGSGAASRLISAKLGGTDEFVVDKAGIITSAGGHVFSGAAGAATTLSTSTTNAALHLAPNGTGQVLIDTDGSVTLPVVAFNTQAGFGLRRVSSSTLGLTNGTKDFVQLKAGQGVTVPANGGFSISNNATDATTTQVACLDDPTTGANTFRISSVCADNAAPVAMLVRGMGSRGGTDTNIAGADITYQPGPGTGTGLPSRIRIQAPTDTTASGSTQQTMLDRLVINGTKTLSNTTATATTVFTLSSSVTNRSEGGVVHYQIMLNDGTDWCSLAGEVTYVLVAKASTRSSATSTPIGETKIGSGTACATLSTTWAFSSDALQVTPSFTAITPTTVKIRYSVFNNGEDTIATF